MLRSRHTLLFVLGALLTACETPNKNTSMTNTEVPDSLGVPSHFSVKQFDRLLGSGDVRGASDYVNTALHLTPNNAALHFLNGLSYQARQQEELAEIAFDRARSLDQSAWKYHYCSGMIKANKGSFRESQAAVLDAYLLQPNNPTLAYALAYTSYCARDLYVAINAIEACLRLCPGDPKVLRAATMIYAASGNKEKADQCFQRYQTFVKDKDDLHRLSERTQQWYGQHRLIPCAASGSSVYSDAAEGVQSRSNSEFQSFEADKAQQKIEGNPENVIIDCMLLRSSHTRNNSAGSNILNVLEVTGGGNKTINFDQSNSSTYPKYSATSSKNISLGLLQYGVNVVNAEESSTEVKAYPSLTTIQHKPAFFLQGNQYIGSSGGAIASSVSSVDAGTKVEVTILDISDDGYVTMKIFIAGVVLPQEPALGVPISEQVVLSSQSQVDTTVRVKLGKTVLLGGIYAKSRVIGQSGFPVLSSLPVIGWFFGKSECNDETRAIAYFITPRLEKEAPQKLRLDFARNRLAGRGLMSVKEYSNYIYVLQYIEKNPFFAQFRTGDLPKPFLATGRSSLVEKLQDLKTFLWF